jgi:GntR family transcriptional regulator
MSAQSSSPTYVRIERYLRQIIQDAHPGDPLPSDSDLCERFSVSRMTARHAVQVLATEGLLYRVSGTGTFVGHKPVHRRLNHLLSFSEEMSRRGLRASSKLLSARMRSSTSEEAVALQIVPGDRVVDLQRLRLADDTPMALENVVLPASCSAVLDEDLASGSLHLALESIGRMPFHAFGSLTARPANRTEARLLGLKGGAALLVERRTIQDQEGIPIEYTETRYVGDRYVFDVELQRATEEPSRSP